MFLLCLAFLVHMHNSQSPLPPSDVCGNNYRIKICNAVNKFFNIAYIITQLEPKVS